MTYEETIIQYLPQLAATLPDLLTVQPQLLSFAAGVVCGYALLIGLVNR